MKTSIKSKLKTAGYAVGSAALAAAPFMPMAFAAPSTTQNILSTFLGYVVDMFIAVGVLLGVWAVAQLALSFKNEDADSKSRAMMMLIVAAILIGIAPLANVVISGTNISIGSGFLSIMPWLG